MEHYWRPLHSEKVSHHSAHRSRTQHPSWCGTDMLLESFLILVTSKCIKKYVYQLVLILKNEIFAKLNRMKIVVVSSREFRANQRKYFDLALTDDVVITSRSHGSYRLVPVRESDTIIDQTTLEAEVRRGIEEYEQGKVHRMEEGESVDGFLSRMINED